MGMANRPTKSANRSASNRGKGWARGDKIAAVGLPFGIIASVAGVVACIAALLSIPPPTKVDVVGKSEPKQTEIAAETIKAGTGPTGTQTGRKPDTPNLVSPG